MGQKVHPHGFRVGIYGKNKGWRSIWYAKKSEFSKYLYEDFQIRRHLKKNYKFAAIPMIEIERKGSDERVTIYVHTARPAVLIGQRGTKLRIIEKELVELIKRPVNVQIKEVKSPNLSAQLLAEYAAEQLERRASFRRTMKTILKNAQEAGALGCRIRVSGRLGGADMARSEHLHFGSIPLQTLGADIDYGFTEGVTTYSVIGVKVWLYKGKFPEVPGQLKVATK